MPSSGPSHFRCASGGSCLHPRPQGNLVNTVYIHKHSNLLHVTTQHISLKSHTFVSHGKTLPQVVLINLETLSVDYKDSLCVKSSPALI